ncbi:MAG TPA: lipase family protein [Xanthobacteraceae bacterium]|nr:lipase family protein [Xanthobacteraceae bacterium]
MSAFTQLPTDRYSRKAFEGFTVSTAFVPQNALALAWMSQLAYETDDPKKIADILAMWGLGLVQGGVVVEEVATVLPQASTHCIVAAGPKFAVVAIAGTDPVVLANWITNFDVHPGATGTTKGHQVAANSVWPRLKPLIAGAVPADGSIFVTGHSLGGALATVIADRISTEPSLAKVNAVYTFGMSRPGDATFAAAYNQRLGPCTYRLVHGEDLVPTVAPSFLGFRHVGRHLRCDRLGKFSSANLAPNTASDEPSFVKGVSKELTELVQGPLSGVLSFAARMKLAAALVAGVGPAGARTDLGGIAIELLPPRVRDHMPDRYIAACESQSKLIKL